MPSGSNTELPAVFHVVLSRTVCQYVDKQFVLVGLLGRKEEKVMQFPTVSKFEPSCILKDNHIFELSKQEVESNHRAIRGEGPVL